MKKLVLSEIMLLSLQDRKAKRVTWDPKRTLILGVNSTGKSSLIKSIYQTFGASPKKMHPNWANVNPMSLIKFKIDGVSYSILRNDKLFSIFNDKKEWLANFSNTLDLRSYLAELFDFKLRLPGKDHELITPSPSYMFLPFYIDQDSSWTDNWNSFSGLSNNWRDPVVHYHTGIRPNEYYEIKGETLKLNDQLRELDAEKKVLRKLLKSVENSMLPTNFDIDIEVFKNELAELLVEAEKLNKVQESLKEKLVNFHNIRFSLVTQLEITKEALKETSKDYKFASDIHDHGIDCPTCGQHYENSFSERFSIAQDEDRCKDLIQELKKEIYEVEQKIEKQNQFYKENLSATIKINEILEKKQGEIKLRDIIEKEGKKELTSIFGTSIETLTKQYFDIAEQIQALETKLAAYDNKERKELIQSRYIALMKKFLYRLDVRSLKEENYKNISGRIQETGSNLPRALFAYYFAILHLMKRYSTSCYCPIIIDSPNQQAQDPDNLQKILSFINTNQPTKSQLILGLEDKYDFDFDCPIVELKNKYGLLQENEFKDVNEEMRYYIETAYENNTGELFD